MAAMFGYKDLEWQGYQYPRWSIGVGWVTSGAQPEPGC